MNCNDSSSFKYLFPNFKRKKIRSFRVELNRDSSLQEEINLRDKKFFHRFSGNQTLQNQNSLSPCLHPLQYGELLEYTIQGGCISNRDRFSIIQNFVWFKATQVRRFPFKTSCFAFAPHES